MFILKDDDGIRSNENLILVEIADRRPFGKKNSTR